MNINFTQGIISYPYAGNLQSFLTPGGGYVSFDAANGSTNVAIAHGSSTYLVSETVSVPNAWGPLQTGVQYWLYWDVNTTTAAVTRGFSTSAPIASSSRPSGVVEGQHWFDTTNRKMYIMQQGQWRAVIRAFAASVIGSVFAPLGAGFPSTPYAGTQAGIFQDNTLAGRIIVDNVGNPIRRSDGRFFTTEDDFFVNGSPISSIRLETGIVTATAGANLAKYQVVKYSEFDTVVAASYNDVESTMIAMVMEDVVFGSTCNVCIQGRIDNPQWNFGTVGVPLWVTTGGALTPNDPHITDALQNPHALAPVARVISPTSVIFDQGLGMRGEPGLGAGDVATTLPELLDVTLIEPQDGQVLTYEGGMWSNRAGGGSPGGGSPGGPVFSLQYNDDIGFNGDGDLTWSSGGGRAEAGYLRTPEITAHNVNSKLVLIGASLLPEYSPAIVIHPKGGGANGDIEISAGWQEYNDDENDTEVDGGELLISSGDASLGNGGDVRISAGRGHAYGDGQGGHGGDIIIKAGSGDNAAGQAHLVGGYGTGDTQGGRAVVMGGGTDFPGGSAGDVYVLGGYNESGEGQHGQIRFGAESDSIIDWAWFEGDGQYVSRRRNIDAIEYIYHDPAIVIESEQADQFHLYPLTANTTVNIEDPREGQLLTIRYQQDNVGGRSLTFVSPPVYPTPTINTEPNAFGWLSMRYVAGSLNRYELVNVTPGGSASGSGFSNGEAEPTSPSLGDRWYRPSVAKLFTRINDGVSDQWVEL